MWSLTAARRASGGLERLLETETKDWLGADVEYFVRSANEWEEIISENPFAREAKDDPSHLVVMFMRASPAPKAVKALQAAIKGPEYLRASGKQLYVVYPAGIGTSKLTNAVIERTLGVSGSGRNWNTVVKLSGILRA